MKFFIILLATALVIACNSSGVKNIKPSDTEASTDSLINSAGQNVDSPYINAAKLITANDCLTCHRMKDTSIGPSYFAIAAKYHTNEGNVENLAHSIIHGSKGIWGEKAMTPHPNLSQADAKEMVRYILSLDTSGD